MNTQLSVQTQQSTLERLLNDRLHRPCHELQSRPQKNFRSHLVKAGFDLVGVDAPTMDIEQLGLALEELHTGSLIIDDIQDGSIERRGAPCVHLIYGVPSSINAGNWLYFQSLARLKELPQALQVSFFTSFTDTLLKAHKGQSLDLGVTIADLEWKDVETVCNKVTEWKTGELIGLALSLGALYDPELDTTDRTIVHQLGVQFGITLQRLDDIEDLINDPLRCEFREGKPVWPWAYLTRIWSDSDLSKLWKRVKKLPNGPYMPLPLEQEILSEARETAIDELEANYQRLKTAVSNSTRWNWPKFEVLIDRLKVSYKWQERS